MLFHLSTKKLQNTPIERWIRQNVNMYLQFTLLLHTAQGTGGLKHSLNNQPYVVMDVVCLSQMRAHISVKSWKHSPIKLHKDICN